MEENEEWRTVNIIWNEYVQKFDMISNNDRTYKENGMTWRKKGRKLKLPESKMKGTWKGDEKENETNGKGNQRNIRRTWKNIRKGGKLNKVNVRQRYDWRKWKKHGRKWKDTDRRNEREMARTRKELLLYVCILDFFHFHTYKVWPPRWPRSRIPNSLSVRFWAWHEGTMKGYEQRMEGHGKKRTWKESGRKWNAFK